MPQPCQENGSPTVGQEYLGTLPIEVRRSAGQVYTPEHLVDFVLDTAGYTPTEGIDRLRALDPACGAGALLLGLIERLAKRLMANGVEIRKAPGRRTLLRCVEQCIHGVDKDPAACELAGANVRALVADLTGRGPSAKWFSTNIHELDFLEQTLDGIASAKPAGLFDVIVGNPPYVATTRLTDAQKNEYRTVYRSANGRIDLYALFFERALGLLEDGGRLAFITPNKFLTSESARPLRQVLAGSATVEVVANFRSHRVFPDAATVPCITVMKRGEGTDGVRLLECAVEKSPAPHVVVRSSSRFPRPSATGAPWNLARQELLKLADKIRVGHRTLETLSSRVSAGIATGRDGIYVLADDVVGGIEPELLSPAVRGQDVGAYSIADSGRSILIPYLDGPDGHPELVHLGDYPGALRYLHRHRKELVRRHCVRKWDKAWYDIHDPWTHNVTAATKIIVPDVAQSSRFAFDDGLVCPLHSAYYVIPDDIDPLYLTAVLNSTPIEFLVRLLAPVVKDGFSRYRKQFLVTLPIPTAGRREKRRIIAAVESGNHAEANALVTALFHLPKREISSMRSFIREALAAHK